MRGSYYINLQIIHKGLEEVAELAGTHPYTFELEDTSSADHSDSCSEENELQEYRLFDIPIDNCCQ